jgi:uncharacterized lipoprotein YddW (UPF0748 family)
MHMKFWNGIFLFLVLQFAMPSIAQQAPKHEFRAAWIATIGNIDWPSKNTADAYTQQQELITLLNTLQAAGLNAVILQVRPSADALYKSSYEGWSKYTSGTEGVPPNPYYDPLAFAIEECHKRGMELHAWFNPYRSLVDARKNIHPYNHVNRTHPEWFFTYAGKQYFNPGIPAVREYVQNVVCEVVKNYDIDAVHFDDYFYPYKVGRQALPDEGTYYQYGASEYSHIDDWRRSNTDKFMQEINTKIKAIKPYVKLGISPFGVWRNYGSDADGSNTRAGVQNYDDLYANVTLWQKKGWIDYLLPQLYWERGHRAADYTTLLEWWSRHAYGRAMYIGQGLYQVGVSKASAWRNGTEIPEQIEEQRLTKNIHGYALYSAVHFYKNRFGVITNLQTQTNISKALVPAMAWLDNTAPMAPSVSKKTEANGQITLSLQQKSKDANMYVVYAFSQQEKVDISNASRIVATFNMNSYVLPSQFSASKIVVTSLDRAKNESVYTKVE